MWLKNVTLSKDGESTCAGVRVAIARWLPDRLPPARLRVDPHPLHVPPTGLPAQRERRPLWQELKQERFTTPLLRGWLPHIRKELELKSLLTRCHTLDCTCCILAATSIDLDSIVEFGLKNGSIVITADAA